MNPDAKEFVPAHILKRRQEEAERVNEITQQIDQVGIDDRTNKTAPATQPLSATTEPSENNETSSKTTETTTTNENVETSNNCGGGGDDEDSKVITSSSNNDEKYLNTNGEKHDPDNEDDRYLLKGGEAFCEFNGEQFIIPGEDDEYEPSEQDQYRKNDFDFGNAEDNEDEEVCNAYEQFLDELPE